MSTESTFSIGGDSNTEKVFAIHQANYLPWMGYFSKLANCDVFVFLDAVQYPRGKSFAARNRVKTSNGVAYLTVPVSVPSGNQGRAAYLEVRVADQKWKTKHLKSLELSYKRAPFFEEIFPLYRSAVEDNEALVEINIALIAAFAHYLKIETQTARLSEILPDFGQKTQLIVDIAKAVGANVYLSGTGGGQDYNDQALLNEHNIELRYSTFEPSEYPQLWGDFESHLSIIDALFNCGPSVADLLKV